jgi:peptidoglycan-associated lipoprotein
MKMTNPRQILSPNRAVFAAAILLSLLSFNCGEKKKPLGSTAPVSTPVAKAPEAPATIPSQKPVIASFAVEPTVIERGQSAVLRWSVTGAAEIQIDNGVGTVPATGNRRVIPAESTTYRLTASGPGGEVTSTATATVTAPSEPPPARNMTDRNMNKGTLESRVATDLQDAFFDYDSNNIRDDARASLTHDAEALKKIFADFPTASINLEGHCDERGSAEYNLGLGDRRSTAARDFLTQLGVPADRLKTISYGKERPACTDSNESCWQRNRRAHFSAGN